MIPYFAQPRLPIGPLTIHAFGVLVAAAVLVGTEIVRRRAARDGLDVKQAARFVTWAVVGGFIGAHLVDRFVYFPEETLARPITILRFWEGISSFGGFAGGTVGALCFIKKFGLGRDTWRYVDSIAYAFPFGWIFGRTGCFVAFDHPGAATKFFLGEEYVDGIVRHNLGLEEALYTIGIAAAFAVLGRRSRLPGFFLALFVVLYAPFRFMEDFLRTVDVRYAGFTPGQYGSAALLVVGLLVLKKGWGGVGVARSA